MPKFLAIKIHYDHRASLAPHLKYSIAPTVEQYNEYLALFNDEGVGGNGFHECLNFSIPEYGPVQFYLPPTSIPARSNMQEELVVFSFTYKSDRTLPAHIVGVHAGVKLLSTEQGGLPRNSEFSVEGIEPLHYHAEAPSNLVTLLTPPLSYDNRQGRYTPPYQTWGYGLRYMTDEHASHIIAASLKEASISMRHASNSERMVLQRQIDVLIEIDNRYGLGASESADGRQSPGISTRRGLPNVEIGYAGEQLIYQRELAYVNSIDGNSNEVEWISQSVPSSPYDIKTIRKTPEGIREHYLEVKSSGLADDTNVYISSGQFEFFEANEAQSTFVFVNFSVESSPRIREITLSELKADYDFIPIKFKIRNRILKAA